MGDAVGQGIDFDRIGLIGFFGGGQFEMGGRRFNLDDMGAEKGRHMGGIGDDVDRRLALFGQVAAARIGPDHHG